ncbi:MAG: hypothetical protein AAF203_01600 [Pseudomonadota bacterium]
MRPEKEPEIQLTPKQENYIDVENHCCLCGTPLHFEHEVDMEENKVIEKAHCPCCKVSLKENKFSIQ